MLFSLLTPRWGRGTHLVLDGDSVSGAQRKPLGVEFVPLPQGEEPDHAANYDDGDRVDDQEPVKDDEAGCDVVALHDSSDGH